MFSLFYFSIEDKIYVLYKKRDLELKMDRKPDIEVNCVEFVRDAYYKEKSMDQFF